VATPTDVASVIVNESLTAYERWQGTGPMIEDVARKGEVVNSNLEFYE
jgi:hypothetical protein